MSESNMLSENLVGPSPSSLLTPVTPVPIEAGAPADTAMVPQETTLNEKQKLGRMWWLGLGVVVILLILVLIGCGWWLRRDKGQSEGFSEVAPGSEANVFSTIEPTSVETKHQAVAPAMCLEQLLTMSIEKSIEIAQDPKYATYPEDRLPAVVSAYVYKGKQIYYAYPSDDYYDQDCNYLCARDFTNNSCLTDFDEEATFGVLLNEVPGFLAADLPTTRHIDIKGRVTLSVYDENDNLIEVFENVFNDRQYREFGHFHMFAEVDNESGEPMVFVGEGAKKPGMTAILFNGNYKIRVISSEVIEYEIFDFDVEDAVSTRLAVTVPLVLGQYLETQTFAQDKQIPFVIKDATTQKEVARLTPEIIDIREDGVRLKYEENS